MFSYYRSWIQSDKSETITFLCVSSILLLAKITDAQNETALSYHKVRKLYFQATVFVRSIM